MFYHKLIGLLQTTEFAQELLEVGVSRSSEVRAVDGTIVKGAIIERTSSIYDRYFAKLLWNAESCPAT